MISVAEPKPKDDKIKTGVHLNWPDFVVNQEGAIQLMHHTISTLNKIYTSRDWAHDIDSSVYGSIGTKGSGFRMPWSHKKSRHNECKGLGCSACEKGKMTEGEYLPIFLYKNGKMEEMTQEPTVEKLLWATVRTSDTNVNVIPECVVLCQTIIEKPSRKEGDFTASELKNQVYNSELERLLEQFIQKNMEGQSDTRVQAVFKFKDTYLVKSNSRYCENIKRNHSSNHIKLIIDRGVIYQRCFCTCLTVSGRKGEKILNCIFECGKPECKYCSNPVYVAKFCKDFRGQKHNLSREICKLLY